MNKITVPSLMLMLMGFFASNVHAELVWTTGSCAPSEWTALPDNLLRGVTGTISGNIIAGYSTNDPGLLTDGKVPQVGETNEVHPNEVGFQSNANVVWTFAAPKTLERVRISCGYPVPNNNFSGLRVISVEMQTFGSSTWMPLNAATGEYADNGQNAIQWLVLSNENGGPLAEGVGALRVTFGTPMAGYASYCGEIEAVGRAGAVGPTIGSVDVAPAKTKAIFSGSIASAGTDATECDVYLAIGDSRRVRIAKSVSGSFQYVIKDLQPSTTYSYNLYFLNNAPTPKESVQSGSFTTKSVEDQTISWSATDVDPAEWLNLPGDLLERLEGKIDGAVTEGYSTRNPMLVTDARVPQEGGNGYRVGFQRDSSIEWMFDEPKDIGQLRVSACYFEGPGYNRLSISSVEVRLGDFEEWVKLKADAFLDNAGRKENVVISATLSDSEMEYLAKGATGLKVVFGDGVPLASYVVEIEAIEYVYVPDRKPGFSVIVR